MNKKTNIILISVFLFLIGTISLFIKKDIFKVKESNDNKIKIMVYSDIFSTEEKSFFNVFSGEKEFSLENNEYKHCILDFNTKFNKENTCYLEKDSLKVVHSIERGFNLSGGKKNLCIYLSKDKKNCRVTLE